MSETIDKFQSQIEKIRAFSQYEKDKIFAYYFYTGNSIIDTCRKFGINQHGLSHFLSEQLLIKTFNRDFTENNFQPKTPYYETEDEMINSPNLSIKVPYYFKFESEKTIGDLKAKSLR